jgi:serine/threonine-protein kinase
MKKIIGHVEYEILNIISEGGMGTIFKALQKSVNGFEKTVAIKTLLKNLSKDNEFIDRFIIEAKLVANLVHEIIVQIYQFDYHKGEYFFVLEFVDGISLYSFLDFLQFLVKCMLSWDLHQVYGLYIFSYYLLIIFLHQK